MGYDGYLVRQKYEKLKKQNWDKEFEDELIKEFHHKYNLSCNLKYNDFSQLLLSFINEGKVKIKCKDGCIQIERVK